MNRNVIAHIADYDSLDCLFQSFKKHEKTIPAVIQKIIEYAIYVPSRVLDVLRLKPIPSFKILSLDYLNTL
jgi:hypothetical protein